MPLFNYPIQFSEDDLSQVRGHLELEQPLPFQNLNQGSGFYRPGKIALEGCADLDLVLYDSPAISAFMYLRQDVQPDPNLLETAGLSAEEIAGITTLTLPGQLCLGAERTTVIGQAMQDLFAAPPLGQTIKNFRQQNLAVFPIAREGLKYQVAEAIFKNSGCYCDEIVLDAHHVFDSTVPVYNRKVEMTLFKDKDLDRGQRQEVAVAFIADSIASGLVMKEVIEKIRQRFEHIRQVEVIAPLATIRGLSRIARSACLGDARLRVHVFETLLNALPPDYYYSAHFNLPDMHIQPQLENAYRAWWGVDAQGRPVADTACAGYGWSEVFFSPRKQIQMINDQLGERHNLTIADIIRRNL
jgi:hypothetical protein